MTTEQKIATLKVMTSETDADILSTYLSQAEDIVLKHAYPFDDGSTQMPSKYDNVQLDIACYLIEKIGAEGQNIHNENGVDRRWEDGDIPPTLLRRIVPMAGVL